MKNIALSTARVSLLGEYLVQLSLFTTTDQNASPSKRTANQLRILFLVSDVLHADKYHRQVFSVDDSATSAGVQAQNTFPRAEGTESFAGKVGPGLEPYLAQLTTQTAIGLTEPDSIHETKLKGLLSFWESSQALTPPHLNSVREAANRALDQAKGRRGMYKLPAWFGGENTPWRYLPVSSMLLPDIGKPDRAVGPRQLRPVKFNKKELAHDVCDLLDDYFENIDLRFRPNGSNPTGGTENHNLSLDPMGQMVKASQETGEKKNVGNSWWWSEKMCKDMQTSKVPERIQKLRDEYEPVFSHTLDELAGYEYNNKRRGSRSPYSSDRSRQSSFSSYDSNPRSPQRRSRRRPNRRRRTSDDAMDVDRPQAPPNRFGQGSANPHFTAPPAGNHTANHPPPPSMANHSRGHPPPPPPYTAPGFQPGFPTPPQAPGPFTGQPGMQQYPLPSFQQNQIGHPQYQPGQPGYPPFPLPIGMYAPQQYDGPHPGYGNDVGFNNNAYGSNDAYGNGNAYGRGGFGNRRGGYGGNNPNGHGQPQAYGQQLQQPQWNQNGPPHRGGYGGHGQSRGNWGNQRGPSRY